MNTEEFIAKALEVHPDHSFEHYHLVRFVSENIKVKLTCPNCKGTYHQTPESHLRGNACPLCYPAVVRVQRTPKLKVIWLA